MEKTIKNMPHLISIIIPAFNRSHLLGETLDSILKQTYENWECIVIDDASTDYTNELMEFYCETDKRIKYYNRPKDRPKGANTCRNYGFHKSKGEFINWFDSDDLMNSKNFLEASINELHLNPDLDLVVTDFLIFSDSDKKIFHTQQNEINDILIDYITGKVNFGCPCILWRKTAINLFKYDEKLSRAQELDFHFRVFSESKINYKHLPGPKLHFRRHSQSLTSDFQTGNLHSIKSELAVRRRIIGFLWKKKYNQREINSAFKIYLSTFRHLAKHHSVKETFKELHKLEDLKIFNKNYLQWKNLFFILLFLYKLTGREYRMKIHLKELTNLVDAQNK